MLSSLHIWRLITLLLSAYSITNTQAMPAVVSVGAPEVDASAATEARFTNVPKYVDIKEDVIPDVENTTQKVLRVNPLDLPAVQAVATDATQQAADSSLYTIQMLLPIAQRNYVNSNRMRKTRVKQPQHDNEAPILRSLQDIKTPKPHKQLHKHKKHLHFLYEQDDLEGHAVGKSMRVHVAPGAYPVYYVVSKTNGRFGKFPIKGFRTQAEFQKYLVYSKAAPITHAQRFDS